MQVFENGGGEVKPVVLHSSQSDDGRHRGMLDLLTLSLQSDIATEISRQDLDSVRSLELHMRQARINVSVCLLKGRVAR